MGIGEESHFSKVILMGIDLLVSLFGRKRTTCAPSAWRNFHHAGALGGASMKSAPILVTGVHRGGTTWVGKMIAHSPNVYYLDELFNPDASLTKGLFPFHFRYIPEGSKEPRLREVFQRLFELEFEWPERKHILPSRLSILRYTRRTFGLPRPLQKDPIALFSAPWLAQTFGMQVVCLLRHPAGFVASLRKAGWSASFTPILRQPQLMDHWLGEYHDVMHRSNSSFIQRAALIWTMMSDVLIKYVRNNPSWLLMRTEDLAADPLSGFQDIFSYLDLPFGRRVSRQIRQHSSSDNPAEWFGPKKNMIRRNSVATQELWKKRLSRAEILEVRRIAEPISCHLYEDRDWN